MIENRIIFCFFILIGLFGIFLRTYKIESLPENLTSDEISIAFDAYSLNRTKMDVHKEYLPMAFKSTFDTYKAPGYAYLLSPLYSILKNNNTTARLPSLISGLLTIFVIGLITYEFTKNKYIAYLSSITLLITPWHIICSRMILESNLALLFFALAIYLFQKSVSLNHNFFVYLSATFFSFSMYCYHTEWGLAPILFVIMLLFFYKNKPKKIFLSLLLFLILSTPLVINYLSNLNTNARANTEGIWKNETVLTSISNHSPVLIPLIITKSVIENYFIYSNINNLFFNGTDLHNQGLFLWPLIIPFFLGLINLKKYVNKKQYKFLIIFILISPLISAFTRGPFNYVRNLNSVLPYVIIIAIGLYSLKNFLIRLLFGVLIIFSLHQFYILYTLPPSIIKSETIQYYRPLAEYLKNESTKYRNIYIDYRIGKQCHYFGVPELYLAYYQSLNPSLLQNKIIYPSKVTFDKYIITQIDWASIQLSKETLYIVPSCNQPPQSILKKLNILTKFNNAGSSETFEIWQIK